MVTLHRRSRVGPVGPVGPVAPLRARECRRPDHVKSGALTMIYEESSRIKRQNAVGAHQRTNLPRDHSAAQTYSATAAFLRSERCDRSTIDIGYDRDRNRFIAASSKPIEVGLRVRVGDA
jgi:hypothetical protein